MKQPVDKLRPFPDIIGSLFKSTNNIWIEIKTQRLKCIQQIEVAVTHVSTASVAV